MMIYTYMYIYIDIDIYIIYVLGNNVQNILATVV